MEPENTEFWNRARQARDTLVERFLNRPEVSLIDIGYDPEDRTPSPRVVLRVHVRQPVASQTLGLPDDVDGIPVRLIVGDYHLE